MIPGEIITKSGVITLNSDREPIKLKITNTGDRPIQVGSHFHFYEANVALDFDRKATKGRRLDIPAGSASRDEPGQTREVDLGTGQGKRNIFDYNAKIQGSLGDI